MLYAYFIVIIVTAYDWVKLRVALRRLLGVQLTLCPPRRAAYTLPPPCVIVASDDAVDPAVAYLSSASANTIAIATSERWRGSAACRRRLAHILAIQNAPPSPAGWNGAVGAWPERRPAAQRSTCKRPAAEAHKQVHKQTASGRGARMHWCRVLHCCWELPWKRNGKHLFNLHLYCCPYTQTLGEMKSR